MDSKSFGNRLADLLPVTEVDCRYPIPDAFQVFKVAGNRSQKLEYLRNCSAAANKHANDATWEPLDQRIAELCELYDSATLDQRAQLHCAIDTLPKRVLLWLRRSLLHFARRMAVQTLRQQSTRLMRLGLLALSIEEGKLDYRDTSRLELLLWYAAVRAGLNAQEVFEEVRAISSPAFAATLRTPIVSLGDLPRNAGFVEGTSADGPTLEWTR